MHHLRTWARPALSAAVLLIAFVLLLGRGQQTWPSESASPEPRSPENVYRAPLLNNPRTLDPARVQDIYGALVVHQLFDGLVQFSRDLFVIPALAETWRVEDQGRTYRFSLRRNAKFHNGRAITAEDVVFSLSRLFRVRPAPTILPYLLVISGARDYVEEKASEVVGLQAVDEQTLVIRLEKPYVPFLVALGMYHTAIVPREAASEDDFASSPIGSGPFKLVAWEENVRISLERYSDYYGGPSSLDGITFVIYPGIGIEGALKDFQAGKLEEMPVYPQFRSTLKEVTQLQWLHRPALGIQFYGFNVTHPHLRDSHLRAALAHAIDRPRIIADVYGGEVELASGILPPGLPGYQPQGGTDATSARPEEVRRERLSESKEVDRPIEIVSNSQSPIAQAELNMVKESWRKLGFQLEPRFIPEWEKFEQYLRSDSVQVFRYMWSADIPDPDDFVRVLFASDSPVNYCRYRNPEVDEMLSSAVGILDPLERARRYREIETAIMTETPAIPMLYPAVDMVYQPYVRNMEVTSLGAHAVSYHRIWLDRKVSP